MRFLQVLPVVLVLATAAQAAPATKLEVARAWSRPAAAGTNGVGYLTLANRGPGTETLLSVETVVAQRVEMHQTSMAGGIMSMQRLDKGLIIAPGKSVTFAPGGYHLMLIGLQKALAVGDRVPATLVLASGVRIKTTFPVGAAPPPVSMRTR